MCSFQAYGMSALPLNLIKGTRNAAYERLENTEDIEEVEQHIQAIRSKVSSCLVIGSVLYLIHPDVSLPWTNPELLTLFESVQQYFKDYVPIISFLCSI